MKTIIFSIFAFFLLALHSEASMRIRRVPVQGDQIVTVKTSIGIATIIQVPDRPNSVVVGDQDSFKVEYLDQAITIKPLTGGAKSNLYIYTDWKRFNVELVSGAEA
ncbi:MAG: TrbG/VirB9 family P-type conjugative transfer protein, partial [Pseudobdellovibrio sp.]